MIVADDVIVIDPVIAAVNVNVNDTLIVIATLIVSRSRDCPHRRIIGPEIPLRLDSCRDSDRQGGAITSTVSFPFACTMDGHGADHVDVIDHDHGYELDDSQTVQPVRSSAPRY